MFPSIHKGSWCPLKIKVFFVNGLITLTFVLNAGWGLKLLALVWKGTPVGYRRWPPNAGDTSQQGCGLLSLSGRRNYIMIVLIDTNGNNSGHHYWRMLLSGCFQPSHTLVANTKASNFATVRHIEIQSSVRTSETQDQLSQPAPPDISYESDPQIQ